jgi:hypothetical protein
MEGTPCRTIAGGLVTNRVATRDVSSTPRPARRARFGCGTGRMLAEAARLCATGWRRRPSPFGASDWRRGRPGTPRTRPKGEATRRNGYTMQAWVDLKRAWRRVGFARFHDPDEEALHAVPERALGSAPALPAGCVRIDAALGERCRACDFRPGGAGRRRAGEEGAQGARRHGRSSRSGEGPSRAQGGESPCSSHADPGAAGEGTPEDARDARGGALLPREAEAAGPALRPLRGGSEDIAQEPGRSP